MKPRRPLSDTPEEEAFLRADEACDKCAAAMKASILGRMQAAGAALHRPSLAMALAYAAPSAIRLAFKPQEHAHAWTTEMLAAEQASQKAGPKVLSESEIIDEAVDAGIELGLDTLPAKIRDKVDVGAAKKLARKRLLDGMFRQNVAAYEESLRGLEKLASASRLPSMATLVDIERLASMFGLTSRQAAAIVRGTEALFNYGPKNTKARLESIRRAMVRQIQSALEARAEVLAQTIGREAISSGQQALFETAKRQGLLDEEEWEREWVNRKWNRVCPVCLGLNKKRAKIGESFVSDYDGQEYFQSPAHPFCQCGVRLVRVKTPKRKTRRGPATTTPSRPPVEAKAWEERLTKEEEQAVKDWTFGGKWEPLNEAIREGRTLSMEQEAMARGLDSAIVKAGQLPKQMTVFRGINFGQQAMPNSGTLASLSAPERIAAVKNATADFAERRFPVGATVELGGFQSTSTRIQPALDASLTSKSSGIVFEIRATSGADLSKLSRLDDEGEILLPRNSRFKVTGVSRSSEFETMSGSIVTRTVVYADQI